jgi:hypothetical protein
MGSSCRSNECESFTNELATKSGGSYDVVVANTLHAVVSQIATLKVSGVQFTLADNFADRATTNSITSKIEALI